MMRMNLGMLLMAIAGGYLGSSKSALTMKGLKDQYKGTQSKSVNFSETDDMVAVGPGFQESKDDEPAMDMGGLGALSGMLGGAAGGADVAGIIQQLGGMQAVMQLAQSAQNEDGTLNMSKIMGKMQEKGMIQSNMMESAPLAEGEVMPQPTEDVLQAAQGEYNRIISMAPQMSTTFRQMILSASKNRDIGMKPNPVDAKGGLSAKEALVVWQESNRMMKKVGYETPADVARIGDVNGDGKLSPAEANALPTLLANDIEQKIVATGFDASKSGDDSSDAIAKALADIKNQTTTTTKSPLSRVGAKRQKGKGAPKGTQSKGGRKKRT